jgi:hypothetical protein
MAQQVKSMAGIDAEDRLSSATSDYAQRLARNNELTQTFGSRKRIKELAARAAARVAIEVTE